MKNIKFVIALFIAVAAFNTALFAQDKQIESHAILLQYHRFGEAKYPSTDISMELFTKQINYLAENNYNVWPLSKIVNYLMLKKDLPPKTVAITIDDAYKTVYTRAYPLLKKHHYPSTIFVNSLPIIHHSKRYMTWDEMKEMGEDGAEFANHTYSHQYLVRMFRNDLEKHDKEVTKEILKCETKLEKELGKYVVTSPKMLAYPFGEYDTHLMNLIKKLGYVGIAQNSGPVTNNSNLQALPRFPMSGNFGKMKSFILKLNTVPLVLKKISTEETIVSKINNPPKFSLTLKKPAYGLQCFTSNGKKIDMKWKSKTQLEIQSSVLLKYPRDHYTCTAMYKKGQWRWYSHMWVVLKEDENTTH
ncbi:polysaccharide deacetylase family protein [Sulfurimonas sp.]|uniref:polysaccharide deacetylase family protein n=1 Tax=Sulfurimonas sp. TaxID=2022749 RepID=UPI00262F7856|nr:polysaccharide deacetylase family protein [Sulfurimonas sp.]